VEDLEDPVEGLEDPVEDLEDPVVDLEDMGAVGVLLTADRARAVMWDPSTILTALDPMVDSPLARGLWGVFCRGGGLPVRRLSSFQDSRLLRQSSTGLMMESTLGEDDHLS